MNMWRHDLGQIPKGGCRCDASLIVDPNMCWSRHSSRNDGPYEFASVTGSLVAADTGSSSSAIMILSCGPKLVDTLKLLVIVKRAIGAVCVMATSRP